MEKKRLISLRSYSIIGLLIGVYAFYTAYRHTISVRGAEPAFYWTIGFTYILFSLGAFTLINWVRIAIITVSYIVSSVFIITSLFLFLLRPNNWQWGLIFFVLLFPVFILSIYSLIYLTRPKVKEQFK